MDAQSQARAKPEEKHGRGSMKSIMRSIGKLKQAGFEEGQTRAMAEFVEELVGGTVQPIVLGMNQRSGEVDLRLNQIDQRFEQVDQRFDRIDQRFEQVDLRFSQIDQRFEQVDQRFDRIDQRFEQVDQRFGEVDQRLEQINSRIGQVEYWMKQGFEALVGQIEMLNGQIRVLAGDVRRLQSRPWLPYLIIGLAFSGLYIAMLGILLAALERMSG